MFPRFLLASVACLALTAGTCPAKETLRMDNVTVSHNGISEANARAIGRTVAAARAVAVEKFGFDMPSRINVRVTVAPKGRGGLFTDGEDSVFLTIRSEADLRQPRSTGIFHLYGLCHEVGHMTMYRPIQDRGWMTSAAAEGWAHYLGSRIVDEVYRREGPDLWPDRYDYRQDGMRRLERQLASSRIGGVAKGAGLWRDLVEITGDRAVAPIFKAWGGAKVDPADPAVALGKVLGKTASAKEVSAWWKKVTPTFVQKRAKSDFHARKIRLSDLRGEPRELAHDDGRKAKAASQAGSAHGVRFETPGKNWCVTSIRLHGSCYGHRPSSRDKFQVWICDEKLHTIAEYKFPYTAIRYGRHAAWATVKLKPTPVPAKFIVCVGFNPTSSKGVFMSYDAAGTGNSLLGLPGKSGATFDKGDWMIRATIQEHEDTAGQSDSHVEPMRQWASANGKFETRAKYLGFEDGKVHLEKLDGTTIEVPLEKLSPEDQRYVRRQRQKSKST